MTHTTAMPKIDLSKIDLTDDEMTIVKGIVNSKTGLLRASKPEVERHYAGLDNYGLMVYKPDLAQGMTAYVWRMVVFQISPKSQHHCMPCTADFDIPYDGTADEFANKRALTRQLDALADKIVNSVPKSQWHGITRWAQAYGLVGTPQYDKDGAIVYR